ncbi:MAG: VTT domain-containing protein [Acidobacteriaceae bacterium]
MKHLLSLYEKYSGLLLAFLKPLGFWGIGVLAIVDSSSIPMPMDAFIVFYAWHDKAHFYLYVLAASVGSAIGGLLPYFIGRVGGELVLLKRINREKFNALRHKFERQEFVAVFIPSMLPPPTPWKLFVFGAGVFEMPVVNFIVAVFAGRVVRFGVESLLVIRYGPEIMHTISALGHGHMVALTIGISILIVLGVLYYFLRYKKKQKKEPGQTKSS